MQNVFFSVMYTNIHSSFHSERAHQHLPEFHKTEKWPGTKWGAATQEPTLVQPYQGHICHRYKYHLCIFDLLLVVIRQRANIVCFKF